MTQESDHGQQSPRTRPVTRTTGGDGHRAAVIADVARLAGVSVPTVSRVLRRGQTGAAKVRPDKERLVLDAIKALNYRPSATARALASRESQTIAIITGDTSRYGYAETIRGIEEAARADRKIVTITVVDRPKDAELTETVALVLDQRPAGIVVLKYNPAGAAALKKITAGVPVVAISGTRSPGVPQVALIDERQAGELLTDYLLGLGHRTVHHVRMPQPLQHNPRMTGWRLALERAGAPVPPVQEATWQPESGRQVGLRMAADPAVTAVFCGNDEIAMGFIKGLTEAGRRVPDDVSVVGFDDHPLAAMWNPGLTTIRQDFVTLGHRAYQRLQGDSTSMEILAELPELVIRDSAAPPRPQRQFASAG